MIQLEPIGKVVKSHGVDGAVKIILDLKFENAQASSLGHFFMRTHYGNLPFFIETIQANTPQEIVVKFEEINSKEMANKHHGATVFAERKHIAEHFTEPEQEGHVGFTVIDDNQQKGVVVDEFMQADQYVLCVVIEEQSIFLPCIEPFVTEINKSSKTIYASIPESLKNLNQ